MTIIEQGGCVARARERHVPRDAKDTGRRIVKLRGGQNAKKKGHAMAASDQDLAFREQGSGVPIPTPAHSASRGECARSVVVELRGVGDPVVITHATGKQYLSIR